VAGAYTVFANTGKYVHPSFVRSVRGRGGDVTYTHSPESRAALDPRVAYLVTDMMADVINRGTGGGVRQMGFRAPAAGKTGTSRDGWFAGFTSELICVVWVGFDDNRELGLEGSKSALPIWTEFMKRAHTLRGYENPKSFQVPKGLVQVAVDPDTGLLAGPDCPSTAEYFIRGTEPAMQCSHFSPQVQMFGIADRNAVTAHPPSQTTPDSRQ
jgi:penicillin-binding protein 1B